MKTISKIIVLLICFIAVCVVLRTGYFMFSKENIVCFVKDTLEKSPSVHPLSGQVDNSYNFKRMLDLISTARITKKEFYTRFSGIHSKQKVIDVKATRELLADLYREKIRLQKYIWETKARYKGVIPIKRKRTLLHYQIVIDSSIQDIEKVLRLA